jgi:demethylmenaquinone methyltransferase/2-methoxy-6-polyprenyl-1,4-benzoquinol methylase
MTFSGWFYKTFVDPILVSVREKIAAEILAGQTVLDVACGTGALVFQLARKSKKVVGIDLSEPMIKAAKKEERKQHPGNVSFEVADATRLSAFNDGEFDVVTLSMALHQFSPELHAPILDEIKRVGKKLIIVDYAVPLPRNVAGISARIIEFLAGKEHYQNFRRYYRLGGLRSILSDNSTEIESSLIFSSGIFTLVTCNFQSTESYLY